MTGEGRFKMRLFGLNKVSPDYLRSAKCRKAVEKAGARAAIETGKACASTHSTMITRDAATSSAFVNVGEWWNREALAIPCRWRTLGRTH